MDMSHWMTPIFTMKFAPANSVRGKLIPNFFENSILVYWQPDVWVYGL
jgi:hypothetical protein